MFFKPRFFPYFCTQFLGAFNDSLYKNAILIIVLYQIGLTDQEGKLLTNIAAALFILPFFLFGALAGQLADKYPKVLLIRRIKLAEVVIILTGCVALYFQSLPLMFTVLFFLGIQSAFFGPIKYAILPQYLGENEILKGNGYVEAGTFLAILIGTLMGGLLTGNSFFLFLLMFFFVFFAYIGWISSQKIPLQPASDADLVMEYNVVKSTIKILKSVHQNRPVFLAILAVSWFWFFGSVLITQFPIFAKNILYANERVANVLLAVFSIGIGLGSVTCAKLSKGRVEMGLMPFGAIGVSVFVGLLAMIEPQRMLCSDCELRAISQVLQLTDMPWVIFYMFMAAFCSGIYIVPLYTFIQLKCEKVLMSRAFAANNIMNSLFMVAAGLIGFTLFSFHFTVLDFFLIVAIVNIPVTFYIISRIPDCFLKIVAWLVIHSVYRLKKVNTHNIPEKGGVLLVSNHVSFFDPVFIFAASVRPVRFVMYYKYYYLPIVKYLFRWLNCIPIGSKKENPEVLAKAYQMIDDALKNGDIVCIFPEGGITRNGDLQPFQSGVQKILKETPVPVVPLALRGLWGTWSSFYTGKALQGFPRAFMKKVTLVVGEVISADKADKDTLFKKVQDLRGDEQR